MTIFSCIPHNPKQEAQINNVFSRVFPDLHKFTITELSQPRVGKAESTPYYHSTSHRKLHNRGLSLSKQLLNWLLSQKLLQIQQ